MKQFTYLLFFLFTLSQCSNSLDVQSNQDKQVEVLPDSSLRTYIFGHSLLNHAIPTITTTPNETAVPHWLFLLSEAAGNSFSVSGQYGFLPQHDDLPPTAQWGFDIVPSAWDSDIQQFSEADFNSTLITAANFIQYQPATVNYDGDANDTSPLQSTLRIIDWLIDQEPDISIYIYENWPDMAPYIAEFPPQNSEVDVYHQITLGDFHDWWIDYHDELLMARPDQNIRMIPVGPIIAKLLVETALCDIPLTELYEDDAPHGRPTIYFLASLITYMAMNQEQAPSNIELPSSIHSLVHENYDDTIDFIWAELESFTDGSGNSRVW